MKKSLSLLSAIGITFLLIACDTQQKPLDPETIEKELPAQPHVIQDTKATILGDYLGSDYKGNYVWGGAMNLAWMDLAENVIEEAIELKTEEPLALEMLGKLNAPVFKKEDLDEESYYIKSGYGQETVEAINKESKEKFPTKTFGDLTMKLGPKDILAYAYFLKEVEYLLPFEENDVRFMDQWVKGFSSSEAIQNEAIKIVNYETDDKFIIGLDLKDDQDQLFLAKGFETDNPQSALELINKADLKNLASLDLVDNFSAPILHLDYHRDYVELIGSALANKDFESYFIAQMYENIKFDMDQNGARVENEAVIELEVMSAGEFEEPPPNKNFILNQPYWVIMKRHDSPNPYFILGINNTELMEKADS